MKYITTIYKLYTENKEIKLMETSCNDTFLDACDDAETEIEWMMSEASDEEAIRGYRYEIVGLDGSTFSKEIEC